MFRLNLLIGFSFLFLISCIDDIDIDIDQDSYLVIDGLITTDNEPNKVIIYKYKTESNSKVNVENAHVIIKDDANNSSQLIESKPGEYVTQNGDINGVVGRCYTLEVMLENGEQYISKPEDILSNVGLESIRWEEGIQQFVSDLGNTIERNVINVYINSNQLGENPRQYRWRYKNIYEFVTEPENRTTLDPRDPNVTIPDPPECSGYRVDFEDMQTLVQFKECECCECYITEFSDNVIVSDAKFISGAFQDVKMNTFLIDERFRVQFYVEVEQLSLSDEAYAFWSLISRQSDNNSSIFASTPAEINSNIMSIDNPDQKVLGYFGASDVSKINLTIKRGEIQQTVPTTPIYTEDCRYRQNSTTEKPNFW